MPVSLFSHSAMVIVIGALPILAPAVIPSVLADDDPAWLIEMLPPTPPPPVRVGFRLRAPQKVRNVDPVYSEIAQAARLQGVVIIDATISEAGRVINARILRPLPLLDQSALDAVRQWEFTPSLLNGVPVPVIMTVTVNFTLSR